MPRVEGYIVKLVGAVIVTSWRCSPPSCWRGVPDRRSRPNRAPLRPMRKLTLITLGFDPIGYLVFRKSSLVIVLPCLTISADFSIVGGMLISAKTRHQRHRIFSQFGSGEADRPVPGLLKSIFFESS